MELSKILVGDACGASRIERAQIVNVSIHIFSKKSIVEMAIWARNLAGGGAMGLGTTGMLLLPRQYGRVIGERCGSDVVTQRLSVILRCGPCPLARPVLPPPTTTQLVTQTAYAKYRVGSNVCVRAREFQVAPSCYSGCGGPLRFSRPFRWVQANTKPPKRAAESRWGHYTGTESVRLELP